MKYIILIILVAHGLIHLMGFVKELDIAPVKGLSGDTLIALSGSTKKVAGMAWLLTTILICTFSLLWWIDKPNLWYLGAIALVLSQLLIILYWKDAKFGSIGNVILLLLTIYAYGQHRFQHMVQQEIKPILSSTAPSTIVTTASLQHLPQPVRDWLQASGTVGKPQAYNARLKQQGSIRLSEEQGWTPVTANQYFNIATPTFVWVVDAQMKGIHVVGRDKYENGKGAMLIKPLGIFTAVDATGEKTDQGSMLRYLSELCWIPSSALQDYLVWQQVDSNSATVSMTYKGKTVSALYTFDEQHRVKSISAKRYMDPKDDHLTDWYIPITHWASFDGITIPAKGDVIWQLPNKDFNYYQWNITDINYNIDQPY